MSGIYIPDVKFPPKPWSNILIVILNGDKQTANFTLAENLERVEVPFVSIPDHGRLCDLDELYAHLNEWYLTHRGGMSPTEALYVRAMLAGIKDAPTIVPIDKEV